MIEPSIQIYVGGGIYVEPPSISEPTPAPSPTPSPSVSVQTAEGYVVVPVADLIAPTCPIPGGMSWDPVAGELYATPGATGPDIPAGSSYAEALAIREPVTEAFLASDALTMAEFLGTTTLSEIQASAYDLAYSAAIEREASVAEATQSGQAAAGYVGADLSRMSSTGTTVPSISSGVPIEITAPRVVAPKPGFEGRPLVEGTPALAVTKPEALGMGLIAAVLIGLVILGRRKK